MNIKKVIKYVVMIMLAILFLFPLYWAIISIFKSDVEILQTPPTFVVKQPLFENILDAWTAQPFTKYFLNSLFVTFFAVVGSVVSTSFVAYGFARYEFKFKRVLFGLMLATMMIPWDVLVIPLYKQYSFLGWIDTYLPLVIPSFFGVAFYIFLMVQFLRAIPRDFDEAAKIEGLNDFQIFYKIFIPIMRPQLILIAILHTITVWNDYLGPLVYLNSPDNFTLAIGLSLFSGAYTNDIQSIMTISVIMVIPPLLLFMCMQKYILGNNISTGFK